MVKLYFQLSEWGSIKGNLTARWAEHDEHDVSVLFYSLSYLSYLYYLHVYLPHAFSIMLLFSIPLFHVILISYQLYLESRLSPSRFLFVFVFVLFFFFNDYHLTMHTRLIWSSLCSLLSSVVNLIISLKQGNYKVFQFLLAISLNIQSSGILLHHCCKVSQKNVSQKNASHKNSCLVHFCLHAWESRHA